MSIFQKSVINKHLNKHGRHLLLSTGLTRNGENHALKIKTPQSFVVLLSGFTSHKLRNQLKTNNF